ncbi:nitrogen regulation protein NR(II) [Sphingomonas sp. 28-62-20]|uniref:two-component system sensor histidine kinase NtrB n=1 Tax=Sphingomonas sp. 28-62-20 TaxID=1970433 RepID=UPI0035A8AA0B
MPAPQTPSRPHFAELLAALPVPVVLVNPAGLIAYANSEAELLLNISERAMQGQELGAILALPAGYRDRRAGLGFAAYDSVIDIARGGRVRIDFIEAMVADHPGWRIITLHHGGASRRLGQSDRVAARSAVGAAAMLAHEIKNPLSGIRGAAQLLANGVDAGDSQELTTLIVTEVDRIAALIDRMQDFTDTRPLAPAPHNIYPMLDHARRVALAGFARDVLIDERFDPSLPEVMIDRDAMLQVVLNLLKNACEATNRQADRRVMLTTAYRHGMALPASPGKPRQRLPIELCVIDNGPGAPADIADHLFDPFVSGKPEGQGLGLALVDKLVRDMGGIIQYAREGAPEQTVFRLLLPAAAR